MTSSTFAAPGSVTRCGNSEVRGSNPDAISWGGAVCHGSFVFVSYRVRLADPGARPAANGHSWTYESSKPTERERTLTLSGSGVLHTGPGVIYLAEDEMG